MIKCPSCGEENPPKFKLCGYCGTPLPAAPAALPAHEVRKTVTLVFTDLKDSTALGERLDSEALHEVKERYFKAMAAEILRHGGKIEKYIGDAIMAVFGLPRAHEDDALRAVRAAADMRAALARANADLAVRFGVTLAARTGVNTGEVVASDDPTADQKLATGDAVNVTARLEAAAPADEIYIGEVTYRLVRDAVEVEAVEPLTLKGKSQPVPAYRVVRVHGHDGNLRRHDTPMVGREAELAALQAAYDAAVAEGRARLVTVIGDAGVGKSRLVRELMQRTGAAGGLVAGRCLPYGEGITFWPLREMLVAATGIRADDTPEQARERVLACVEDPEVADRLAAAAGLSTAPFPLLEIYWAARKFLQAVAAKGPVVAMFDDIHWAEPAFLDLILNLLDTIEGAPVLLLATARHDLIEEQPEWGQVERATRLVLQPLGTEAATQVARNLLGDTGLSEELIARIVEASEGNPLYVEQMLSMLIDSGAVREEGGRWVGTSQAGEIAVPPTIHALLEARLDRLERAERATAEPAAVIGLEFPRPAVESLAPAALRDAVGKQLATLEHKHFIRAAPAEADGIYRFHHQLVRDTVYNGLLKRARAQMHTEFVRWADRVNAEAERGAEFEAILGYHLEQAYRYLGELGPLDETGVALGRDAARRLASAGRRALGRGDMHAAANLIRRATGVLAADDPARIALLPELAETLMGMGDFAATRETLAEARERAQRSGDQRTAASAQLIGMFARLYGGEQGEWSEEALQVAQGAIAPLEREQAHSELATAWRLIVLVHGIAGRYRQADEAIARSIHHARLAGNERLVARNGLVLSMNALYGPTPVPEAIAQCERLIEDGLSDRQVACSVMCALAQLKAMNGELDAARGLYREARAVLRDLGQGVYAASTGLDIARVELHGGDLELAEREVRADYEFLASKGETYFLSTMAALLSRLVRDQGRDAEALEFSLAAEKATAEDDVESQALWRAVRAPIVARDGRIDHARELAHAALELTRRTEAPSMQADALAELAVVLAIAGDAPGARQAATEAMALYAAKGNRASAARLASLGLID